MTRSVIAPQLSKKFIDEVWAVPISSNKFRKIGTNEVKQSLDCRVAVLLAMTLNKDKH